MHNKKLSTLLLFVAIGYAAVTQGQAVFSDDVQDFNNITGVGCFEKIPVTKNANFNFTCKSRKSEDHAWYAVMHRVKRACGTENIFLFAYVPPILPAEHDMYGAQAEFNCVPQP